MKEGYEQYENDNYHLRSGFIAGYNASQKTNPYSEEDMRKCWYAAREHKHGFVDTALDKYIDSLTKKYKKGQIIQIEVDGDKAKIV